jgi:hypothetical protein
LAALAPHKLHSISIEHTAVAELVLSQAGSTSFALEDKVIGQRLSAGEALKGTGSAHHRRLALRDDSVARNNAARANAVLGQVTAGLVSPASAANLLARSAIDEHVATALHHFVLHRLQGFAPLAGQH